MKIEDLECEKKKKIETDTNSGDTETFMVELKNEVKGIKVVITSAEEQDINFNDKYTLNLTSNQKKLVVESVTKTSTN